MKGRCPFNTRHKHFLLMENFTLQEFSLNVGTIIVKDTENYYFYYPAAGNTSENSETKYRSIFRGKGKNLTAKEEEDLIEKCLTVGSEIQLNNIKHKITCFLVTSEDPDGFPDFSGFLKCEDGMTINIQDIVNQVNQQTGGRYSRSRKRTYKRKSKSRRKKRAF